MTQPHIDDDTLSLFIKTTTRTGNEPALSDSLGSTQYENVLDHLAHCEKCRKQASIITALQDGLKDVSQHSELTDEQHDLICDHIDGQLPADKEAEIKKLITSHPDAMRAALHYQEHSENMRQALHTESTTPDSAQPVAGKQETRNSNLISLFKQFFSIRSPMVYTMTATAAVFVAILLVTRFPVIQQQQLMVATYQDNPTIKFTDNNKLPGIGFFTQSTDTAKLFEDIMVELVSENKVRISWPDVEGAELYKMRIQVFNQGKKTVLKEQSTQNNHTTFQLEPVTLNAVNPAHNKRYEWVLYGNTRDDRMFYASGGFVISKAGTDDRDNDTW